jgi:hypothetical protein
MIFFDIFFDFNKAKKAPRKNIAASTKSWKIKRSVEKLTLDTVQ